eukprot:1144614-Pelagomonas_calceolata.AAC.7
MRKEGFAATHICPSALPHKGCVAGAPACHPLPSKNLQSDAPQPHICPSAPQHRGCVAGAPACHPLPLAQSPPPGTS